MTTKDTLINVGLLAGGVVATLAAAGVYGKGSRAKRSAQDVYRHRRMAALDPSEWPAIPGMQGPFRYESGDILYYDPREGKYYDRRRDLYVQHPSMGSMTRDGSYEATLMFDADEDDSSLRAQRALDDNPYVPQATPLTRQAQRTITSAQGSAGRQGKLRFRRA